MAANTRTITLKCETIELLQTVKSCFQLGRKKNISYDEIITTLIEKGLVVIDPKVAKLLEFTMCSDDEQIEDEGTETNL